MSDALVEQFNELNKKFEMTTSLLQSTEVQSREMESDMRTCDGALAKLKEGEAGNGAVYRSVGKAFVLSSRSAEQTRMGELKEKYAADVSSLKTRNAKLRTSATQLQTQLQEIVKELQAQPASA